MTQKRDFISGEQGVRKTNGKKFIDELAIDGGNFGLTPLEIGDATAKYNTFDTEFGNSVVTNAAAQAQTQTTNTADTAFEAIMRKLAGKMKKSDNYNATVGERYKIIGDEISIDIATAAPVLKLRKVPSGWEISFNLLGFFTGAKIYRKRPGDAEFSYKATDLSSPYIDTDPQVNGTQYQAYFIRGDVEVGQVSATVTVEV